MKKVALCGLCGEDCVYVNWRGGSGIWIHVGTQHWNSGYPRNHDCNTHIDRGTIHEVEDG